MRRVGAVRLLCQEAKRKLKMERKMGARLEDMLLQLDLMGQKQLKRSQDMLNQAVGGARCLVTGIASLVVYAA